MHCIGAADLTSLHQIIWGIDPVPDSRGKGRVDSSHFVRSRLCGTLVDIYRLDSEKLEVRRPKSGGELQPPRLYYENKETPFDISLSHDGRFAAYAFVKHASV